MDSGKYDTGKSNMAYKTPSQTELKPNSVLCIGAHTDDTDVTVGGTVAKWAAAGADVYYLVLTNGNKGSDDLGMDGSELVGRRREEQRIAARILRAKDTFFC